MKKLAVVLAGLFLTAAFAALAQTQAQTPAAPPAGAATASPATAPASQPTTSGSQPAMTMAEYEKKMEDLKKEFKFVPMSDWKGMEFVFMKLPKIFAENSEKYMSRYYFDENDKPGALTYKKAAGRIFTVLDIRINKQDIDIGCTMSIKMNDDGKVYQYKREHMNNLSIEDIAPVADIKKARSLWKGKTLWMNLPRAYIYPPMDKDDNWFIICPLTPVVITEVEPSDGTLFPVRFIFKTDTGKMGYQNCTLSGTNGYVDEKDKDKRCNFDECFYIEDLRKHYSWDKHAWKMIMQKQLDEGMSPEQVFFSGGKPDSIKHSTTSKSSEEYWEYKAKPSSLRGDVLLTFENGILKNIK